MKSAGPEIAAEFLGTALLVATVVGSGIMAERLAGGNVALALLCNTLPTGAILFVLITMFGPISGAHFNPVVTGVFWCQGEIPGRLALLFCLAQVAGGIAGAGVLYVIASGKAGFDLAGGFASNGYAAHSPGGYSMVACLVAEIVLTLMFLVVILGATDGRAPKGFAPLAIGLCLTLIYLVTIPITSGSVNPARSTGPALFAGGWAIQQLWMFWVAPILGAMLAGFFYSWLAGDDQVPPQEPVVGEEASTTVVEIIEN